MMNHDLKSETATFQLLRLQAYPESLQVAVTFYPIYIYNRTEFKQNSNNRYVH